MKKLLQTERTILRQFTVNDIPALMSIMGDLEVMRFSIAGPMSKEAVHLLIEETIKDYEKSNIGKWAIIEKSTNKLIGMCALSKTSIGTKEHFGIAYRLAKAYWNKGLTTEVVQAVCDYAFNILHVNEIVACIDKENIASVRVAEKVGLTYWKDGVFKNHACQIYRLINKAKKPSCRKK